MQPEITLAEAQAAVAKKTAPRVTEDSIKAKIAAVDYMNHDTLTLAVITMTNGFKVVGKAAPASPANYDAAVGQRYAYEDAFKQLWVFEGYLLCEILTRQSATL